MRLSSKLSPRERHDVPPKRLPRQQQASKKATARDLSRSRTPARREQTRHPSQPTSRYLRRRDNEARLIEGLADTLLSTLVREWKSGRVNLRGDDFEKRVFSRSSFSPYYTRSRPSVGLKTRLPTWRSNKEFANFSFPMADVFEHCLRPCVRDTHTALSQVILNCKGCFQCFFYLFVLNFTRVQWWFTVFYDMFTQLRPHGWMTSTPMMPRIV